MIRTGIFGTSYIRDERRRAIVKLWLELAVRLNPGFPLMIVDSNSPVPVPTEHDVEIIAFSENIGHLAAGGQDGWGRAFTRGLQWAIDGSLDYVVGLDTDILFSRPVGPIFDMMRREDRKVCMPVGDTYSWPENGLFFAEVAWLQESRFIERYCWLNMTPTMIPEWHCKDICGTDLHTLPLRGRRNDNGAVTAENLSRLYPTGCDWITHCVNTEPYRTFLDMNGFGELKGLVP
jgi:hypothetical protein